MIKVLQMIHGFNTGGAETLVKNYALLIDKSRFDLTILCLHHQDSPYEDILLNNGINVIYVSDYFSNKIAKKLFLRKVIKKIIRQLKPDIIHTHLLMNSYLKYAEPDKSTRLFYTQHFAINRLEKREIDSIRWMLANYKTQIIGIDNDMIPALNNLFNVENSIMLRNGIFVDSYDKSIDVKAYRESLGVPKDKKILVHIGRFAPIKNHNFLIDVFIELLRIRNDVFLLMVGAGSEKEHVIEKLESDISINKYRILSNRMDVPEILMSSDIGIMTSFSEGLCISVIEMQAARLPVVSSRGVPNTAKVSDYLFYLNLNDGAKAWANRINELLNSNIDTSSLCVEDWDIRKVVRKLEGLYIDSL